ncbi:MAG TPA: hypothetical protein VF158_02780 [Longimicrobiales bacterium]
MSEHEIDRWPGWRPLGEHGGRFAYGDRQRLGPVEQSRRVEVEREFYESGALKRERFRASERSRVVPVEDPGCLLTIMGLAMIAGIVWTGWSVAGWWGVAIAIFLLGAWTAD